MTKWHFKTFLSIWWTSFYLCARFSTTSTSNVVGEKKINDADYKKENSFRLSALLINKDCVLWAWAIKNDEECFASCSFLYFFLLLKKNLAGIFWLVESRAKSIASDCVVFFWSQRSREEVGGAASRTADSGYYAFSRRWIPLSGVPIGRSHPVVHGCHCRSRRRDRGTCLQIHALSLAIFTF